MHGKWEVRVYSEALVTALHYAVRKTWKEYRYRLETWGCRFLATAIPLLSRRACVGLGQLVGAAAYFFDTKGRRVALANIRLALGEKLTPEGRREAVRQSYQNFAVTMLSLFWSARITPENAGDYLEISGFEEAMARAEKEKRALVLVCAHQGNWEWGALAFSLLGGSASIVAEDFKNSELTEIFIRLRNRGQNKVISQERSILRLLRAVLRGENAGLLGDLNLPPSRASVAIEAFHSTEGPLEMCSTRLHAILAHRGNALIVPVLTFPQPNGQCLIAAQDPLERADMSERALAQKTWEVFEKSILTRPELWLWPYKHFRYRPHNAPREYPFYSQENAGFEQIRQEIDCAHQRVFEQEI
jgi:lauroyl/myristoyl acyltransferase